MSNIPNNDDQLLPISIAASMLGISDQTLRRWVDDGYIGCVMLPSGQRRFRKKDINAIIYEKMKVVSDDTILKTAKLALSMSERFAEKHKQIPEGLLPIIDSFNELARTINEDTKQKMDWIENDDQ